MSLAHDLGQPISSIAMDATVGQRALGKAPADTVTARKAIDRMVLSVRRAADLLDRTREQASRRERSVEPIDLVSIVRASIQLLEHEIHFQGGSVSLDLHVQSVLVAVDRVELQQVLVNLILNAMAASQESTAKDQTIVVAVRSGRDADVVVEVRDQGVGLPIGSEHQIFDPLFSTRRGGMGMGLAICRTIIEAFGGALTASNNAQGGATFSFALPRL